MSSNNVEGGLRCSRSKHCGDARFQEMTHASGPEDALMLYFSGYWEGVHGFCRWCHLIGTLNMKSES